MRNEVFLYVGYAADICKRPRKRDKSHHNRYQAIIEATHTDLIHCNTLAEAKQLEEQLVREHQPIYNLRRAFGPANIQRTTELIHDM